jgi:hypothetical protein
MAEPGPGDDGVAFRLGVSPIARQPQPRAGKRTMAYGVPNIASVEFWRVPPDHARDGYRRSLPRLFQRTADTWVPLFRYHGGILLWAIDGGNDRGATFAIFSSEEGMREFQAGFYQNPKVRPLLSDEAELMTRVTGPMTDTFSHGRNTNSALRELETYANDHPLEEHTAGFLAIYQWRILEDAGPLANGIDLRSIPKGERYRPYLEVMLPRIVRRIEHYQMLGGWTVNTGEDTLTSIGIYPAGQAMRTSIEAALEPGTLRGRAYPNLELIDRIEGPALDLMAFVAGQFGTERAAAPD